MQKYMSHILGVGLLAVLFSGCNLINDISAAIEALTAEAVSQSTAVNVDEIAETALEAEELMAYSADSGFELPEFSSDFEAAGGGDHQNVRDRALLAPMAIADACPAAGSSDALPEDRICSVLDKGSRVSIYIPEDATHERDFVFVGLRHMFEHANGVTGTIEVTDLEAPTGTSEADLRRHDIRIVRTLYGTDDHRRQTRREVLFANLNGCPDDDRDNAFCDGVDDQDDEYFSFAVTTVFRGGVRVEEHVRPDESIAKLDQRAIVSGTYTRRHIFPDDHRLISERLDVVFDRDARTASIEGTREHRDGSIGTRVIEIDDGRVQLEEDWANGRRVVADVDRDTGTYSRTVDYEDTHPRLRLSETGTFSENGGEIDRVIERRDGVVRSIAVETRREVGKITVTYVEDNGAEGTVIMTRNGDEKEVQVAATTVAGVEMAMEAIEHVDGTLVANLWIDRPNVSCDLDDDRDGEQDGLAYIERSVDGALQGEAQFCDAEGVLTTLSIVRDAGEETPRTSRLERARGAVHRDVRLTVR